MKRFKKEINLISLSLEDVIKGIKETNPQMSSKLKYAGMYFPDVERIFINPKNVEDVDDFLVTLLHEVVHYYDMKNGEMLSDPEVEISARYNYNKSELQDYLKKHYLKKR